MSGLKFWEELFSDEASDAGAVAEGSYPALPWESRKHCLYLPCCQAHLSCGMFSITFYLFDKIWICLVVGLIVKRVVHIALCESTYLNNNED